MKFTLKMRPAVSNAEMVHVDLFAFDGRHETHSGVVIFTYAEWDAFKNVLMDADSKIVWSKRSEPDGLHNDNHRIDIKEYAE